MATVKTLNILGDGKLIAELSDNTIQYLQPLIVVNTYAPVSKIRIQGQPNVFLKIDTTILEIDGNVFSGTFDQLDIAIRNLAKKANALVFQTSIAKTLVLEYADLTAFPLIGDDGIVYKALDTNKTYRWIGAAYVEVAQIIGIDNFLGFDTENCTVTEMARALKSIQAQLLAIGIVAP